MGWLSGWSWAKEISLTGQTGAGTLYQVELDIGDSAGGDFHLEGNCTNFPQDIEVTDNDGTTILDFLIEDITADPLKMWVEVADDLGSNQSIWVYYGKSGATTNSNIDTTFPFGDEFPGSSLDTSKWNTDWEYQSGSASVSGGKVYLNCDTSGGFAIMGKTALPTGNFEIRTVGYKLILKPKSTYDFEPIAVFTGNTQMQTYGLHNAGNGYYTEWDEAGGVTRLYRITGTTQTQIGSSDSRTMNAATVYEQYLRLNGDDVEWDINGVSEQDVTDTTYRNAVYPHFQTYAPSSTGNMVEIDTVFVRKYNSPEPAFASAGAEQSAPVGHPTTRRWGGIPGMQYTGRRSW